MTRFNGFKILQFFMESVAWNMTRFKGFKMVLNINLTGKGCILLFTSPFGVLLRINFQIR